MNLTKGFTLVELLVSISIFVFMTVLLVAKYGTFNQSVLLTDTAYDVATTIRTAQTYGISVENVNSNEFKYAYGVDFVTAATSNNAPNQLALFADSETNGVYDGDGTGKDTLIETYTIKSGTVVGGLCVGNGPQNGTTSCNPVSQLDLTFLRPNPDASICAGGSCTITYPYAEIAIRATDGSKRTISIRGNGQISVLQ